MDFNKNIQSLRNMYVKVNATIPVTIPKHKALKNIKPIMLNLKVKKKISLKGQIHTKKILMYSLFKSTPSQWRV